MSVPSTTTGSEVFEYAFRTVSLVRGSSPYVLVSDDFKKDAESRNYRWSMAIPFDIYDSGSGIYININGKDVTLTDPNDATRHCLIKMIDSNVEEAGTCLLRNKTPVVKDMKRIPS